MEVKILKESKDEMEVEVNSLTLVELLRVYLNKDPNVSFVAWKRDHPSRNPVIKVVSKDAKKSFSLAVESAISDLDKLHSDIKSLK